MPFNWLLAAALTVAWPINCVADTVLSSNGGHTIMNARKNQLALDPVHPDAVSIIDVKALPPCIKASFEALGSVVESPGAMDQHE